MTRPRGFRVCLVVTGLGLLVGGCSSLTGHTPGHDPLTPEEHAVLGATYLRQGELKPAAREYEAVVRHEPRSVPAWMALGNIAFEQQQWAAAEQHYTRVLEIDPSHPGAANNLAMVYLSSDQRLDRAEQLAQQALGQPTELHPYIMETLASVYVRQARWPEARAVLESETLTGVSDPILKERLAGLRREIALHQQ